MPKHFDFGSESSMLSFLNRIDSKKTHSLDAFDDINHLAYMVVNKLKKVRVQVVSIRSLFRIVTTNTNTITAKYLELSQLRSSPSSG